MMYHHFQDPNSHPFIYQMKGYDRNCHFLASIIQLNIFFLKKYSFTLRQFSVLYCIIYRHTRKQEDEDEEQKEEGII